jgi:hypothetical protein
MIIYFSDGSGLGRSGRDVAQTELAQPIALRPRRADSAISRHLTGQNCSVSPPHLAHLAVQIGSVLDQVFPRLGDSINFQSRARQSRERAGRVSSERSEISSCSTAPPRRPA